MSTGILLLIGGTAFLMFKTIKNGSVTGGRTIANANGCSTCDGARKGCSTCTAERSGCSSCK